MKITIKLIAFLMCFSMLFECCFTGFVVNADESQETESQRPNIQMIPENSTVKPGDTVRVDFYVDNNAGFWGAMFTCKFDSGLSLVESGKTDSDTGENLLKYEIGDSFSSYVCVSPANNDNKLTYVYSNSKIYYNNYYNGKMLSVYVKVDDNAKEGEYSISFTNEELFSTKSAKKFVTDSFDYIDAKITVDNEATQDPVLESPNVELSADSQNNVVISWNSVLNAQSYDVYKTKNIYTSYQKIGSVEQGTLQYTDTDTPNYMEYYYLVKANYNNKYTYSGGVSITLKPVLSVSYEGDYPELTWVKGDNAIYYDIYRTENGKTTVIASKLETDRYTDTSAKGCIDYKYYVKGILNQYSLKTSNTITVLSKGVHTPATAVKENEVNATCTTDGSYDEVVYCTVCGEELSRETKTVFAGHTIEIQNAKSAACTEVGYTGDKICTVCGETVEKGEEIPETGHKLATKNAKKATYFSKGYTGNKVCSICGKTVTKGKEVSKLKLDKPKIKVKAASKSFKVNYKKVKGATGFQLRYRIKGKWIVKNFNTKKSITKTIKKLKKGKKYRVQVRAFVKSGSKKAYSTWTKSKTLMVKK